MPGSRPKSRKVHYEGMCKECWLLPNIAADVSPESDSLAGTWCWHLRASKRPAGPCNQDQVGLGPRPFLAISLPQRNTDGPRASAVGTQL